MLSDPEPQPCREDTMNEKQPSGVKKKKKITFPKGTNPKGKNLNTNPPGKKLNK